MAGEKVLDRWARHLLKERIAIFAILGVCIPIATTGCGAHPNTQSTSNTPAAASIQVSPATVSFGKVTVGQTATSAVSVTNTGSEPLTISQLSLPGHIFWLATTANPPVKIAAGSSQAFNLAFKPASATAYTGQLAIQSTAANAPALTVPISGSGANATAATTSLIALSASTLNFGSLTTSSSSTKTLTLTATGTAAITVNSVGVSGSGYSISGATYPLSISPDQQVALQVTFKPAAAGSSTGEITVKSDATNLPTATVSLSGSGTSPAAATPQLTLSPAGLSFGNVNVGSSSTQTLTLSSSGSTPVTVSSVNLSGVAYSFSGATFPVTIDPNLQITLQVQFKPITSGSASGQLTVKSTSKSSPTVTLSGTGIATTPKLTTSAQTLNFGSVTVGSSATQALTLTSSGTAAVTVNSAKLSGTGYSLSGAGFPLTLPAGQSAVLQVVFKPTAAGTDAGTIAISSNSAGSATTAVALSGTATAKASGNPTGTPLSACADLTTSGSYYLSQDVSSPGTCFFIDADNIALNLNGHTITYGTGGGSAGTPAVLLADTWYTGGNTFSLAKTGSTTAHGGFEIYNGTIQSSTAAAPQSRGIWVGQSGGISPAPKVHDLVINTTAVDANPIFGDSSLSGWQIYNNTLNYGATGSSAISSRFELFGYAIWLADTLNAPGVIPDQIYLNHIVAAPQGGIYDTNQNNQIHDNDITFNSYFTNDYCVAAVSGNGAKVNNNNCHPTSGRGYDIEAANVTLTNNTATVTELSQNQEYGGCELGGADGIRLKDNFNTPGGGAPAPPSGAVVTGNVITAQATVCQANALRLSFLYPGDTATISGNTFTSTGGGSIDFAISFAQVTAAPLTFSGNTFNSHLAHIQIDYDGVIAGLIQSGQTWAGSPQYSIYDIDGGSDAVNLTHPGLSTLTVEDNLPSTKFCGAVSLSTLLLGGITLACP